ncbi:ATP-binding protein [Micromonospora sp. KC207]|uniref:ATP-binding protein n=1 Tax=Micromonospora sp. KC207 TaxID=2530377 RepID=UPI0014054947|nr:ATP-binding protein [Micromonospora sp. KC207]
MVTPDTHQEAPLLSGEQTVKSIRDTGYKGTDYALAELIDNSFQWGQARTVLLVIVQRPVQGKLRATKRADEIWVIDDGTGMTDQAVNLALSFGGSGKYDDRSGIGRFGMGLPQASVSQCERTDVWTWQKSQPENASHTFLDLQILSRSGRGSTLTVPWPTRPGEAGYETMPDWVLDVFKQHATADTSMGQPLYGGTAIRWSALDRVRWTTAGTILKHAEYLLGRVYRNFLTADTERRQIKIAIVDADMIGGLIDFYDVRPNDPLYLLPADQSTLEFWEQAAPEGDKEKYVRVTDIAPFTEHHNSREFKIARPDGKGDSTVYARLSLARPEARPGRNPGKDTHQGRHARDNAGISVVRAGRELVLEQTLNEEATDRWWGVELSFSPELDEIFGVTNNKQDVPNLTQALQLARTYDLPKQEALKEALFDEEHPIAELYGMAHQLLLLVRALRQEGRAERDAASRSRSAPPNIAGVASNIKKTRSTVVPTPGEKKFADDPDPEKAVGAIENKLKADDVSDQTRRIIIENYKRGVTVQIVTQPEKHVPAFFRPDEAMNLELLCLNNAHPAYQAIIDPLRASGDDIAAMSEEEAKRLLTKSADAITWLLLAYARCENEYQGHPLAGTWKQIRDQWGQRLAETVQDSDFKASELFGDSAEDDNEGGA